MSHIIRSRTAGLSAAARDNRPPLVKPFGADPLHCGSILRIALWRGETDLALRCASTLSVFDPKLLWKTLTLSVLEDHGAEALTLLPLALSASLASKKLGRVWPVAALLVQRIAPAPKSRFYLLAARCLTHDFCVPNDDIMSRGFADIDPQYVGDAYRLFTDFWAPYAASVTHFPTSLSAEFQRLSEFRSWERLDLAEAAWKATRSPSALAFAALECGVASVGDPADCPTIEVALSHQTPRGRLWLRSLENVPPQIFELPETLRTEVYGEALERIETEHQVSQADTPEDGLFRSLGGLSISKALEMARHIRANLPYIRESRRTYLGHLAANNAVYGPSNRPRKTLGPNVA